MAIAVAMLLLLLPLEGPVMMMNWQSINRGQRKNLGFQIHDV
jgi:hypothetical protein